MIVKSANSRTNGEQQQSCDKKSSHYEPSNLQGTLGDRQIQKIFKKLSQIAHNMRNRDTQSDFAQ